MTARAASTDAPRRRARRGEGDRLREDILKATIDLLADAGDMNAVSIRAVAKKVGVTPPSIYLHFPDKRALLDAACEPIFAELERHFDDACAGVTDPLEQLRRIGVAYVRFALDNREPFRIVFMSRCDDEGTAAMTRADLETQTAFRRVIRAVVDSQSAGVIGPADAGLAAMRLWIAAHGAASLLISKPYFPWPPLEKLIDDVIGMAGLGLLVQTRHADDIDEQVATVLGATPLVDRPPAKSAPAAKRSGVRKSAP
ncbi:MAG: regulatory protein TetR [Frankiales bacterium]|nr:regulatory protein TetR [Frankiales bacterium]